MSVSLLIVADAVMEVDCFHRHNMNGLDSAIDENVVSRVKARVDHARLNELAPFTRMALKKF